MPQADDVVLRMRGIDKRFGPVHALRGVDLEIRAGEAHALVGENGAGKSTLMKVLSGAHRPDAGTMLLAGEPYAPDGPLDARQRGIAMIYQELSLAPHLTVAENIVLGREPQRFGLVDRRSARRIVDRALAWLADDDLAADRVVGSLAPGARQLVEVARAVAADARVVVMDEPTSSLSGRETERLFAVIERLRARGVAVVYISHFIEEVRRVAQRYTVLRDGQTMETRHVPPPGPDDGFVARVIEAMAGRSLDEAYPRVPHEPGGVVLACEDLSGEKLPNRATVELRRGEILGIAGLVGAGRTELMRAIFGLDPIRHGRVRYRDRVDAHRSPAARLADGIGMLSEDRAGEGLARGLSIGTNMTLSRPVSRRGIVSRQGQRQVVAMQASRLALRCRDAGQPVGELSGGNQQKVAIARLLHHDVDVLLVDEPTRGIDVATKADIYRLMGELAAQGKSILFVSSYLPELMGVCDRIAVMTRGHLGPARPVAEWTEASLLEAATVGAS